MNTPVNFQDTYLYKLHALSNLLDRTFDTTLRTHADVTLSQLLILMAVAQREGINQRQVARYLGVSAVAVKRQVDLAKRSGWVEFSDGPGRGTGLRLTGQGQATLQKSLAVLERHVFKIFDHHNRSMNLMQHLDLLLDSTREVLGKWKSNSS